MSAMTGLKSRSLFLMLLLISSLLLNIHTGRQTLLAREVEVEGIGRGGTSLCPPDLLLLPHGRASNHPGAVKGHPCSSPPSLAS